MKKVKSIITSVLLLCVVCVLIAACGSNTAEPYIGKWECYRIATASNEIVFSDYAAFVKMELTTEFSKEGEYETHYYVNGEEGDNYPQTGKYEMDDTKIVLIDHNGYGEIVDGELILSFDDGEIKQFFKPIS